MRSRSSIRPGLRRGTASTASMPPSARARAGPGRRRGGGTVLTGRKPWCSLAGVARPGAHHRDGGRRAPAVRHRPARPGRGRRSAGTWVSRGLTAVDSGDLELDHVPGHAGRRGRAGTSPGPGSPGAASASRPAGSAAPSGSRGPCSAAADDAATRPARARRDRRGGSPDLVRAVRARGRGDAHRRRAGRRRSTGALLADRVRGRRRGRGRADPRARRPHPRARAAHLRRGARAPRRRPHRLPPAAPRGEGRRPRRQRRCSRPARAGHELRRRGSGHAGGGVRPGTGPACPSSTPGRCAASSSPRRTRTTRR